MNTVWKTLAAVAGIAMLLTLGVMTAAADTTIVNNSPVGAAYIDNQKHTAPVGLSLWYKFDYTSNIHAKDRSPIFLNMVGGNNSGVEYSVYTWDQVNDTLADGIENWRQEVPTGRGTAARETCGSHIPKPQGECVSNDLTWTGTFAESGPYYVRVRNTTETPKDFTLKIEGADVGLGQSAQTIAQ